MAKVGGSGLLMSGRKSRSDGESAALEALARRIALAQAKAGIRSAAEIARGIKVSEASMSAYLRGRQKPSPEILQRLAEFLGVSPDWLQDGDENLSAPDQDVSVSIFPEDVLDAPAHFWGLYMSLRSCQDWHQRMGVVPTLREAFAWIGSPYRAARNLPDQPIEFKPPEELS